MHADVHNIVWPKGDKGLPSFREHNWRLVLEGESEGLQNPVSTHGPLRESLHPVMVKEWQYRTSWGNTQADNGNFQGLSHFSGRESIPKCLYVSVPKEVQKSFQEGCGTVLQRPQCIWEHQRRLPRASEVVSGRRPRIISNKKEMK